MGGLFSDFEAIRTESSDRDAPAQALSDINPFDAREAKAYQEETEVAAMRRLRVSYDANDLRQFETTLTDKRNNIQTDPFLMEYVDPLRRRMREQGAADGPGGAGL